jgi:hypothetical protein
VKSVTKKNIEGTKWTQKEVVKCIWTGVKNKNVKKVYEELKMNESLYVRKYRAFKKCVVQ